ncbi:MAG: hypothetical protein AAGI34_10575 [Pseudomonadota bacterium]
MRRLLAFAGLDRVLGRSARPQGPQAAAPTAQASRERYARAHDTLAGLNRDPYLHLSQTGVRALSVFDDLKYDRADADILSPAMRTHAILKLQRLGFRQTAGTVLEHRGLDIRFLIPKFHGLGASPFDIARYTPTRPQDFLVLTPTQTACRFIDHHLLPEAVARIRELITTQPINLYRLMDYLERKPAHQEFMEAIGHLKYVQRMAVESEPLCRRRALG